MNTEFTKRLKEKLEEQGISQRELARRLGIAGPSVNAWVNGRTKNITHDNVVRMAQVLNTTPEYLMNGGDSQEEVCNVVPFGVFKIYQNNVEFLRNDTLPLGFCSSNKNLRSVRVEGLALDPKLSHGDLAVLDTSDRKVEVGSVYGLFIKERFVLAYINNSLLGEIVISTNNPSDSIALAEMPEVVGKVIAVCKSV